MGYNTTLVVLNDALSQIANDPKFGEKVAEAIRKKAGVRGPVDIVSGNHGNAAHVVETHHADETVLVSVGGNLGVAQLTYHGWDHHELEGQQAMLKEWANKLGFDLVKKA